MMVAENRQRRKGTGRVASRVTEVNLVLTVVVKANIENVNNVTR